MDVSEPAHRAVCEGSPFSSTETAQAPPIHSCSPKMQQKSCEKLPRPRSRGCRWEYLRRPKCSCRVNSKWGLPHRDHAWTTRRHLSRLALKPAHSGMEDLAAAIQKGVKRIATKPRRGKHSKEMGATLQAGHSPSEKKGWAAWFPKCSSSYDSWSWGQEFRLHVGYRVYFKKKLKRNNCLNK